MLTHPRYVDIFIASLLTDADTLTKDGAEDVLCEIIYQGTDVIAEHDPRDKLAARRAHMAQADHVDMCGTGFCDFCGCRDWKASRHLVGYPSGKDKKMRMVTIHCQGCGQCKLFPLKPLLTRIKIGKLVRLRDNDPSSIEAFEAYRAAHKLEPVDVLAGIPDDNA